MMNSEMGDYNKRKESRKALFFVCKRKWKYVFYEVDCGLTDDKIKKKKITG